MREHRSVERNARYALALGLGLVLAVVASVWAISQSQERDELLVEDLLRVETLPDASNSRLDDQLNRVFEVFGGEGPWTDDDLETRFGPVFREVFTTEALNDGLVVLFEEIGRISFVGVADRTPDSVIAVGVSENGTAVFATIVLAEDGRMETMGLDLLPAPARQRGWQTALALAAGWLFLVAAVAAARSGTVRQASGLMLGLIVSLSAVVVLSGVDVSYTTGRVVPAAAVVVAAWLLVGETHDRRWRWLWLVAAPAAVIGAVAPLTRDATLIGHPAVLGAFADDETLYRVLLVLSAAVGGLAMTAVAAVNVRGLTRLSRWRRPPRWIAVAASTMWAAAAFGSAVDYASGPGEWAGGLLTGAVWVALAAVPVVVAYQLVSARWDGPELASLVIDLEAEGSELQPAIARALDDPSVQVLVSEDGETLVDESGAEVALGAQAAGRVLTQIRSRETLLGGLVHDATLSRDATRVEAVAAAAGLALEVSRLNRQVLAQLDDVTASRARIVQASDAARRRVERDLHDGAQQRLVALGLTLQRARRQSAAAGHEESAALLESATQEVREILDDIRSVSRGSHPALLTERGLAAAIDALAERAPVPVQIDVVADTLPTEAAATVYFVVAEALTNIAKHAEATRASVSIAHTNGSARVEVADDGHGGATVGSGSGLQGLDDRVASVGGSFTVRSGPSGTTLKATIPCG